MKKLIMALLFSMATILGAAQTEYGTVAADLRVFHFDRGFDDTAPRTKALTVGGQFGYVTPELYKMSVGFTYFGSHSLTNAYTRSEGLGTGLIRSSGDDISLLGEVYLKVNLDNYGVKIGRQKLNTPLADGHDLRMLPSSYEAIVVDAKFDTLKLQYGHINAYTGFVSKDSEFNEFKNRFGTMGISYLMGSYSILNVDMLGQYAKALDNNAIAISDYQYADALMKFGFMDIKLQYGGNHYNIGYDSVMVGAKASTTISGVTYAVLANQISGNSFKTIESGPMFSDWQQGYGNYEPSSAIGGQISLKPSVSTMLKIGYVDVDTAAGYIRDDFSEMNIDTQWDIDKYNTIRLRYSMKNQTAISDREDRDDTRVIYYLKF